MHKGKAIKIPDLLKEEPDVLSSRNRGSVLGSGGVG